MLTGSSNERAGLKGPKAIGSEVTINSVPAPLNLFMNIPWSGDSGTLSFDAPKCKANDYVRLKAERDVVVVMSACPQDILDINNKAPTDAHFIVEEEEQAKSLKRTMPVRKRPPPRKITSSHATSTVGTEANIAPYRRPTPQKKAAPTKKAAPAASGTPAATAGKTTAAQTNSAPAPAKPATAAKAAPARKKPVPRPVAPQKKATSEKVPTTSTTAAATEDAKPAATEAATNGTPTPPAPVERKKPRKLTPKPKPEAAAAE